VAETVERMDKELSGGILVTTYNSISANVYYIVYFLF